MVLTLCAHVSMFSLAGYYFAAYTIDKPWMGRFRMQRTWQFETFAVVL